VNTRAARKLTAVALVGLAAFGVRSAYAAGGSDDPLAILVGGDTTEQCASSRVSVDYDVAYDATLMGYGVTAARLSGLDAVCEGWDVTVSLTGPGGAPLAEMTTVVAGEQVRVEVPADTPVAAEHVAGVAVVLTGAEA
jgi:hypothetical protein